MAIPSIPSISVEYVKVPITGPTGVDLDELGVELAIVPQGQEPTSGEWEDGVWIGTHAAVLIGPGQLELVEGRYSVWVRITSSPEIPVLLSGSIYIT